METGLLPFLVTFALLTFIDRLYTGSDIKFRQTTPNQCIMVTPAKKLFCGQSCWRHSQVCAAETATRPFDSQAGVLLGYLGRNNDYLYDRKIHSPA